MIAEKYKTISVSLINQVEGIKRTGLKILELDDRYAKLLMPMAGNGNHVGIMYAGSLFTLGECMGGILPLVSMDMSQFFPIVKEVTIRFVAPAFTDITLTAEMNQQQVETIQQTADENGKADFDLELELKNSSDETIAVVNGIWQIRRLNDDSMKLV